MFNRLAPLLFAALAGCSRLVPESPGAPIGASFDAGPYIATLIHTLEGRVPELHRNPDKDRYKLSLLLISKDARDRRLIPVAANLRANEFLHTARFYGVKDNVLFFEAGDTRGYDLSSHRLVSGAGAPPRPISLSRPVARTTPIPVANPAGQLVFSRANTARLTRQTADGRILWQVDTTLLDIDQILPAEAHTALIGRPPAAKPDAFRQPALILIDNATGALSAHPLTN